jgi:hypothetical protein
MVAQASPNVHRHVRARYHEISDKRESDPAASREVWLRSGERPDGAGVPETTVRRRAKPPATANMR